MGITVDIYYRCESNLDGCSKINSRLFRTSLVVDARVSRNYRGSASWRVDMRVVGSEIFMNADNGADAVTAAITHLLRLALNKRRSSLWRGSPRLSDAFLERDGHPDVRHCSDAESYISHRDPVRPVLRRLFLFLSRKSCHVMGVVPLLTWPGLQSGWKHALLH